MRKKSKLWLRYKEQARAAKQRGIQFLLSFEQWVEVWSSSGHLHERGGPNGYVMARLNDSGAYEIGNIEIITHVQNVKDAHRLNGKHRYAKISAARKGKGRPQSEASREKIRLSMKDRYFPPMHLERLRAAWGRRRAKWGPSGFPPKKGSKHEKSNP